MKKWAKRLAVVLVLALAWLVLDRTLLAPEPVAVRVAEVGRGSVESTVANSRAGTVEARRRAGLSTGTAGIVVSLEVERGERVRAGAVLLRLDDAEERSRVAHAERGLDVARAVQDRTCLTAARARRELARNEALAASGVVSEDTLDQLRTALEVAEAACAVAQAEVGLASAAVDLALAAQAKTVLVAPFDAIVADVAVEVGEWVTPSVPLMAAPDLIDAIDPSSLYVSAPMDEVEAGRLAVGQPARVAVDSRPGETFPGRVVRLAPYVLDVETQNRTLEIEVELEDAAVAATLLPGTSADVEVILEVREDVLRVPTYALVEGGRALVVEGDRIVEREVAAGLRNWDWTEVRAGLAPGDLVVTSLDRPDLGPGAEVVVETVEAEP